MSHKELNLLIIEKHPYKEVMRIALPLILSSTGMVLMQFVDALFLSWYSPFALAAAGSAGMTNWLFLSIFIGTSGYASTFVSQYMGAKNKRQVGASVWQSVYLSVFAGGIVFLLSFAAKPIFNFAGHGPDIIPMEITYYRILCVGGWAPLLSHSFSTFFTGRGETKTLMFVQVFGLSINGFLDYALIFGKFGFPSMGIAGAAIATILAQTWDAVVLCAIFLLRKSTRVEFATWELRSFNPSLLSRMIKFGLPNGFRFAVEMLAWAVFIFFIGRIGAIELASSTIAWRINGFAFFPIIGLAQSVGIIVGHAQGKERPDISQKIVGRGMVLAEIWMLALAATFFIFPQQIYALFENEQIAENIHFEEIASLGVVLLRFVALYCIMDGFNMIYVISLNYAGDTRWTFIATLMLHSVFVGALAVADIMKPSVYLEWSIATIFIMTAAFVWLIRFYRGKWKTVKVIDS